MIIFLLPLRMIGIWAPLGFRCYPIFFSPYPSPSRLLLVELEPKNLNCNRTENGIGQGKRGGGRKEMEKGSAVWTVVRLCSKKCGRRRKGEVAG